MTNEEVYEYIIQLAVDGRHMTLKELAEHLNQMGCDYTPGAIGIGQVVKAAWNRASDDEKDLVAYAFVCADGNPCWQ